MWKLNVAEGGSPWLRTLNCHIGRQLWDFEPNLGSPEDLAEIEKFRAEFHNNRFETKHSSDLLMRYQFSKENPLGAILPQVQVKDIGDVIVLSITGALNAVLSEEHKREICRYLYNHQNCDGANGGEGAMEKGCKWILDHGSATAITTWGKMWLSVLGVFD
ncbi:hypothetical protein K7X08_005237 [Anisodus acutangulus]|uniref:Cycloartenol synthase n=1 Tax=Anisodus acutangulus TaxID=402998 RepID=A0A9Q1MI39_9SOLA|nr:hypothetical protein K7X08_005237 [Anisodus acutangulus]